MEKNSKKHLKIAIILLGICLIVGGYIVIKMKKINDIQIGKMLYITIEDGDADYLEEILESESKENYDNKILLLNQDEVEKLVKYMRKNEIKIISGEYKTPQTASFEELVEILKFESVK